jgi:hypothetical protein
MMAKDRPSKRGPKEDRVKIEGDWEAAIDKALTKKRPKEGWPKEKPAKKSHDPNTK